MQVYLPWTTFKTNVITKGILRFIEKDTYYLLTYGSYESSVLKDAGSEQTDFETNYKSLANKSSALDVDLFKKTSIQKIPMVAIYKPEGSSGSIATHDWCDKTTWYGSSVRVLGEELSLTANESGKEYDSTNQYWIDLVHGKKSDEDEISTPYLAKVYVDAVLKTEVTDYTVNYASGLVTFIEVQTGVVTADYSYATNSTFKLAPDAGKVLILEHAELQFSTNINLQNQFIDFEIWVYNPYNLPNKFMYKRKRYKNIKDVINSANLGQGVIPAIAGLTNDIVVLPFNYATIQPLQSSVGAELRISLSNNVPFTGEFSTATFYVVSQTE